MNRKGFTLLELVTVIIIVGILAAAGVPLYLSYIKDAKISEAKMVVNKIYKANKIFYMKNGYYLEVSGYGGWNNEQKMLKMLNIEIDDKIADDWEFNIYYKSGLGKYLKIYCKSSDWKTQNLNFYYDTEFGKFVYE